MRPPMGSHTLDDPDSTEASPRRMDLNNNGVGQDIFVRNQSKN